MVGGGVAAVMVDGGWQLSWCMEGWRLSWWMEGWRPTEMLLVSTLCRRLLQEADNYALWDLLSWWASFGMLSRGAEGRRRE